MLGDIAAEYPKRRTNCEVSIECSLVPILLGIAKPRVFVQDVQTLQLSAIKDSRAARYFGRSVFTFIIGLLKLFLPNDGVAMEISNNPQNQISKEIAMLSSVDAGLCLINEEMEIMWVNKVMESWFGADTRLMGKKCYKCFARKSTVCECCPTRQAFIDKKSHTSDIRIGFTNADKKRYYKLTAIPMLNNDGEVEKVLESVIDITEKRKRDIKNRRLCAESRRISREIVKLSKTFKRIANKRSTKLKLAHKELNTIYQLGNKLISSLDVKEILSSIVGLVPKLLRVSGCIVRIADETTSKLKLEAASGASDSFQEEIRFIKIGEGISGAVIKDGLPIAISDILKDKRVKYYQECVREGVRSVLATPITFKKKVLGVIIAFSKKAKRFTPSDINLLSTFAAHAAVALNNALLYRRVHLSYYNTITTLVKTMEAKDSYTCGHSERVTNYAIEIAKKLKLSKSDIELLFYAGKLHDIGKIAIPDFILKKTTALTLIERAEIEAHPVKGVEMVFNLKFLSDCFPLILHHHERYDGGGYPDELKSNDIPFLARVLSIADAFDAMTSERPYRRGLAINEAVKEIKNNSPTQFDPQLANLFLSILGEYPDLKIINKAAV